jgi:hypothetical protein
MYHCLASAPEEWPTYYCDDVEEQLGWDEPKDIMLTPFTT